MAEKKNGKAKLPFTRSPNYPWIDLRKAVDRAFTFYQNNGRHSAAQESIARFWGYGVKSSGVRLTIAAIRSFGLIEPTSDGLYKLTGLGLDIVADYPIGSPERDKSIKIAAMRPKLHTELWSKYGVSLPADDELRRYLVRDRGFYDKTVNDFISEYKATLAFSKMTDVDKMSAADDVTPADDTNKIKVGDYVQWTANGSDQFVTPLQIVGISDEGDFAFVAETKTGLPMGQLTKHLPPAPKTTTPPQNPFFKSSAETPMTSGMSEEKTRYPEGEVVLRLPEKLNKESVGDFEYWINGIIRKLKRGAGIAEELK